MSLEFGCILFIKLFYILFIDVIYLLHLNAILIFDNMSSFNNALENIRLGNLALFIVICYIVLSIVSDFYNINITESFYVVILGYFIFMLRGHFQSFKRDVGNVFSKIGLKYILLIVFLNIFLSYGMLYLSMWIVDCFPFLDFLVSFSVPSMSLLSYLPFVNGFIATVIISPISEELIFRGVFLNRLKLYVPIVFAIFISSLLFGALHTFGSMISAIIFAICMAILYLKTENICVPILAHFLNNLFAEIIRIIDVNNILFTNSMIMGLVSFLAIVSAILLIKSIVKELHKIK